MATIIKTTGEETEIPMPTAKEISKIVGGALFDAPRIRDGRRMFVSDTGMIDGLPVNAKASELYGCGTIHGDVVVLTREETLADEHG